jgi:hypothetical protein
MPYNFYDNHQSFYADANQAKLASSAHETDKASLGRASITLPMVDYATNLAHTTRTKTGSTSAFGGL